MEKIKDVNNEPIILSCESILFSLFFSNSLVEFNGRKAFIDTMADSDFLLL